MENAVDYLNEEMLTLHEVAAKLKCSRRTLATRMPVWCEEYGIKAIKPANKWLVPASEFNKIVEILMLEAGRTAA